MSEATLSSVSGNTENNIRAAMDDSDMVDSVFDEGGGSDYFSPIAVGLITSLTLAI